MAVGRTKSPCGSRDYFVLSSGRASLGLLFSTECDVSYSCRRNLARDFENILQKQSKLTKQLYGLIPTAATTTSSFFVIRSNAKWGFCFTYAALSLQVLEPEII